MQQPQTIQEILSSPHGVTVVKAGLRQFRDGPRAALAGYVCEQLELKDPIGKPRLAGVQKALRVLEARGVWTLPPSKGPVWQGWQPRRLAAPVPPPEDVPPRVDAVRGLHLVEVTSDQDELFPVWNELMLREHPLGACRLVGRQIRYLIASDHGWLGGLGFGSCALRLRERDAWIGWDESTRKQFQGRLINLTRLLIRPCVSCQHLASHVLSLGMKQVLTDFAERYGFAPWLVETFVDRASFAGTCFQAANWIGVGATAGRGRNAPNHPVTTRKDIYLYPLRPDWRGAMGVSAPGAELAVADVRLALCTADWVEDEFGGADFGHRATERRLVKIAQRKAQSPAAPFTQCCNGKRSELEAFYRFIDNKREQITPAAILAPHRERTLERMHAEKRVLAIQDSTDLNFSARLACQGLGTIGTNQTGAVSPGLRMHSTLAVNEQGLPLGVLDLDFYPPKTGGKPPQKRPIEEKESYRWLRVFEQLVAEGSRLGATEVVCIGDRESDLFELFDLRRRRGGNVHLLVRAQHNRVLQDEDLKLFDHMVAQPVGAHVELEIPRQRATKGKPSRPGRAALPTRTAQVELRWKKVTLAPPRTCQLKNPQPLEVYAVDVQEPDPPQGAKAVHWLLLSTLPIASQKQALRCLRSYNLRWRTEEWFRLLKSGCGIEAHQHDTAQRLARAITIDTVVGWRVMLLTLLGREAPDLPCELIFSTHECKLLETLQPRIAPERMPQDGTTRDLTLGSAYIIIGRLGGALCRNARELPGNQTVMRGLLRFHDMALAWSLDRGA